MKEQWWHHQGHFVKKKKNIWISDDGCVEAVSYTHFLHFYEYLQIANYNNKKANRLIEKCGESWFFQISLILGFSVYSHHHYSDVALQVGWVHWAA